jgi:hypothetical protein
LYVAYDIELIKPIQTLESSGNFYHAQLPSGITTSAYFGATQTVTAASTMNIVLSATTITWPSNITSGRYLCTYIVNGNSQIIANPSLGFTTNCVALNMFNGDSISYQCNSTLGTLMMFEFALTITGPNAVITFSAGTLPSAATFGELIVVALPNNGTI